MAKRSASHRFSINVAQRRAMIQADQGRFARAAAILAGSLDKIESGRMPHDENTTPWTLRLDLVAARWAAGEHRQARQAASRDIDELMRMDRPTREKLVVDHDILLALFGDWAARTGDIASAQAALTRVESGGKADGNPVLGQLLVLVQADIALSQGHPGQALAKADRVSAHPLWEILDVRARAATAGTDKNAARLLARAQHARALAFGELYENNLGIGARVVGLRLEQNR